MRKPETDLLSCNSTVQPPYTYLYIYYFKGHITLKDAAFGECFIGNWQEDEFSFLFFSSPETDIIDRVLELQPQLILLDQFAMSYEDWLGEKPAPLEIGRFFIAAPWQKAVTTTGKTPILLEPGVVFGTGTHPTTADCLTALDLAFSDHRFETVLDLGTGTGLLAIAAAMLGGENILAADLNFLASRTAIQNVRLNHLEDRILVVQATTGKVPFRSADLVVANIHFEAMRLLLASGIFTEKIHFILSGLLRTQMNTVMEILSAKHARIIRRWNQNNTWHTLYGVIS